MDEEGYIKILGRRKELIKCSGYSVFSGKRLKTSFTGILPSQKTAVIGVPDSYRGRVRRQFIVLKPEYRGKVKEEEMIEWSKENMAALQTSPHH